MGKRVYSVIVESETKFDSDVVSCPFQEAVMVNMDILRPMDLPLTDRELAVLSVSVTELSAAGFNPFDDMYCIQVETHRWIEIHIPMFFVMIALRKEVNFGSLRSVHPRAQKQLFHLLCL